MKKYQKLICVFAVTALMIGCCCFTASAETFDTSGTGSQFDSVITMGTISAAQSNNDGSKYWVYYDHNTGSSLQLVRSLEFKLCPGDTFRWDFSPISFYLSNTSTYIRGVSLGLVNSDLQSIVSFAKQDIVGQGTFVVNFGKGTYTNNTVEDQILYLSVNLVGSFFEETGVISWNAFNYSFSCIDADGRLLEQISSNQKETNEKLDNLTDEQEQTNEYLGEITGDKYDAPESGAVDDVGDVEGEIEQSTQEGFNVLTDTFKSFSLDTFTDGLGGIATIYNRIIPKCPWLFNLINISLGLGLFAFLLGLAQAYIGRLNANDRQARTEKYRQARLRQ